MWRYLLYPNNFARASASVREAVYGLKAYSRVGNQLKVSTGTGFMIAPGIVVTVAHAMHLENDINQGLHTDFTVIRTPDIDQKMEKCKFVDEDSERDIALLEIVDPRSTKTVKLMRRQVPRGVPSGSVGFPLSYIDKKTGAFHLVERFQGAYISSYREHTTESGKRLNSYETDSLMYQGSSGCPGFVRSGRVFGMHNASTIEKPSKDDTDTTKATHSVRLAISLWVPSIDIIGFAKKNAIGIPS